MTAINQILVTYLVNALWQIPTIAVIVLLSALLLRRFPSVYLHRLWVAALLASVLVPFMRLRAPILTPAAVDAISAKQSVAIIRSRLLRDCLHFSRPCISVCFSLAFSAFCAPVPRPRGSCAARR